MLTETSRVKKTRLVVGADLEAGGAVAEAGRWRVGLRMGEAYPESMVSRKIRFVVTGGKKWKVFLAR